MPRKAKEKIVENDIIDEVKDVKKEETKKSRKKSAVAEKKASTTTKKSTASAKKSTASKKDTETKKAATVKKTATTKKSTITKKTVAKENTAEKEIVKKETTKKNTVKKDSTPKDTTKKTSTKKTSTKTSKAAPEKVAKNIDSAEEKVTTKRGRKKAETKVETIDDSATKSSKKTSTEKKAATIKKKSATEKTSTTKKKSATAAKKKTAATKSTTTRKRTSTKKTAEKTDSDIQILEYYDLPYKYGNTIVKLLAQTPKTLFVYWEISDDDINNFKQQYGDEFLNATKPILIVHNLTLNKTSEVEINDFANCWYLNTEDADCKYDIELARKFTKNISSNTKNAKISVDEYLYVAKSNDLQAPNDHIMFENLTDVVTFKNYKTNESIEENAQSFNFLKDIYKFYQNMYKDELLKNPSSKF